MLKTFKTFLLILSLSLTTKTCRCKQETKLDEVNNKPIKIISTQPSTHSNLKAQQNGRSKSSTSTAYNPVEITANNPPNGNGTKDKNKPNGLPNDTYTKCYMNSIFQILASLYIDNIKSTYSNPSWKEDLIIFLKKINNPDKKITKQESTELINKLLQDNDCNLSLNTYNSSETFLMYLNKKLNFLKTLNEQHIWHIFINEQQQDITKVFNDLALLSPQKWVSNPTIPDKVILRLSININTCNRYFEYKEPLVTNVEPLTLRGKPFTLQGMVIMPFNKHYTAYIKKQGQWYYANDNSVITVSTKQAIEDVKKAVLLFYKQIPKH